VSTTVVAIVEPDRLYYVYVCDCVCHVPVHVCVLVHVFVCMTLSYLMVAALHHSMEFIYYKLVKPAILTKYFQAR